MQPLRLVVDDKGVELAYRDSGAPQGVSSYTTVFLIHGIVFNTGVFEKVIALAPRAGLRFVAITRRDFRHSTPLPASEVSLLAPESSDSQKAEFLAARGREIALFVDKFITLHKLPPVSEDGKSGGVALYGWSFGNIFPIAAISSASTLPEDVQKRLGLYLRYVIMYEPSPVAVGTILPSKWYSPAHDSYIPAEYRFAANIQWLTSYFDHGDISTTDSNEEILSCVLPSIKHPPTIFNFSQEQYDDIIERDAEAHDKSDGLIVAMWRAAQPLLDSFRTACFAGSTKALFPRLKISVFTGDSTVSLFVTAFWFARKENEAHGGGHIADFTILKGVNHFLHWDDPEEFVRVIQEYLGSPS